MMKNRINFLAGPLLMLIILAACSSRRESLILADFSLIEKSNLEESLENIGVFGGSANVKQKPIDASNVDWDIINNQISLEFQELGHFNIHPALLGLPASWYGMQSLFIETEADDAGEIYFEIYGSRSRTRDTLFLEAGNTEHFIDIREVPLLGGITAEPQRIRISSDLPNRILITGMGLQKAKKQVYLVDRWGQRALRSWEGKVISEEQFLDQHHENLFLDSLRDAALSGELDRFGAYANRNISFKATGYFRTQKSKGKWWLVSPDGNPFYSMGVNGVRIKSFRGNADVTLIKGREELFESLPTHADYPLCFREDSSYFSFYSWNVMRKYPSLEAWKAQTEKRLRSAGFNTIGNWSDTLYYLDPKLPYTYTLDSRTNPGVMMSNGMPDVYHPNWEKHLESHFSEIAKFREDPFLLGYFVDNEMHWGALSRTDSSSYTFKAQVKLSNLDARKGDYAERYFSTIRRAISKHDPNHLYMGCRFTRNFRNMESIARAAGSYVDIISINVYSPVPIREQMDQWHEATAKPLLIGEHHIPPRTVKQLWPRYPNFTETERDSMVKNYIETWASYPYALGSHWYQYKDQEVAGRGDGGENQPIGLVTVADQPSYRLLELYRDIANLLPEQLGLTD